MNSELYKKDFGGNVVWVTMWRPFIADEKTGDYVQNGYIASFNIGDEPKVFAVEYVKDEKGKVKYFPDTNQALCAAFKSAKEKIHGISN